ncbi:MAG: AEC family transporter [Ruminococcaceae bacterium]|nr:AEC family transporter [Oscillospiraceae bacterium]
MDSLLFAVSAIMPIVAMVAIGYLLKRTGLISQSYAQITNKLVFRLFLPAMLFLNIYRIEDPGDMELGFMLYALAAVLLTFLVCLPLTVLITREQRRRGALLQSTFRSNNALIGVPLAEALCGTAGVVAAALLSAAIIPLYNILAVVSLSLFRTDGKRVSVKKMLLDIVKNPLIESIALALAVLAIRGVLAANGVDFRLSELPVLFDVLQFLSNVATPLALLALGAQFEFRAIAGYRKELLFGVTVRTVLSPLVFLSGAVLLLGRYFSAAHFAVFVSVFATPVAVSSVPMAQEMDSDTTLAGQLVVFTTLVSALSIFLSSFLLRLIGVI